MEPELAKATVEPEKKIHELNNEDSKQLLEKNIPDFSSASSSSSSLSLEFGVDGGPLSGPEPISSPDSTSNQTPPWSMLSASPPPETGSHLLPAHTPGGSAGYDPDRIPASIFSISTKATNPSDWSAASNESLFSIQMGNNSFSQDNAILYGKSGELGRADDWNGPQSGFGNVSEAKAKSKANELSGLPPVIEVSAHEESSLTSGEVSRVGSFNSPKATSMENHGKEKMAPNAGQDIKRAPNLTNSSSTPRTSASNPRLSDESGNSGSSFAFPVLVGDGVKTGSLRRVTDIPEKPPLQAQVSKATHKASERRCFSRLCCWPRCC